MGDGALSAGVSALQHGPSLQLLDSGPPSPQNKTPDWICNVEGDSCATVLGRGGAPLINPGQLVPLIDLAPAEQGASGFGRLALYRDSSADSSIGSPSYIHAHLVGAVGGEGAGAVGATRCLGQSPRGLDDFNTSDGDGSETPRSPRSGLSASASACASNGSFATNSPRNLALGVDAHELSLRHVATLLQQAVELKPKDPSEEADSSTASSPSTPGSAALVQFISPRAFNNPKRSSDRPLSDLIGALLRFKDSGIQLGQGQDMGGFQLLSCKMLTQATTSKRDESCTRRFEVKFKVGEPPAEYKVLLTEHAPDFRGGFMNVAAIQKAMEELQGVDPQVLLSFHGVGRTSIMHVALAVKQRISSDATIDVQKCVNEEIEKVEAVRGKYLSVSARNNQVEAIVNALKPPAASSPSSGLSGRGLAHGGGRTLLPHGTPDSTPASPAAAVCQLAPIGLPNVGNTCYLNSALKYLVAVYGQDLIQQIEDAPYPSIQSVKSQLGEPEFATAHNELKVQLKDVCQSLLKEGRGAPQKEVTEDDMKTLAEKINAMKWEISKDVPPTQSDAVQNPPTPKTQTASGSLTFDAFQQNEAFELINKLRAQFGLDNLASALDQPINGSRVSIDEKDKQKLDDYNNKSRPDKKPIRPQYSFSPLNPDTKPFVYAIETLKLVNGSRNHPFISCWNSKQTEVTINLADDDDKHYDVSNDACVVRAKKSDYFVSCKDPDALQSFNAYIPPRKAINSSGQSIAVFQGFGRSGSTDTLWLLDTPVQFLMTRSSEQSGSIRQAEGHKYNPVAYFVPSVIVLHNPKEKHYILLAKNNEGQWVEHNDAEVNELAADQHSIDLNKWTPTLIRFERQPERSSNSSSRQ